jgi:hypothetical protein
MGSKIIKSSPHSSLQRSEYTPTNGLIFSDIYITEELLARILSYVPDLDVVRICRLVCSNWRDLIDNNEVWILKCRSRSRKVPNQVLRCLQPLPRNFYREVIFFDPYTTRNLIRNPNGEEGTAFWSIQEGGNGWVVESPPAGSDSLLDIPEVTSNSCFATSYSVCSKFQIVNFAHLKISQRALDTIRPLIIFREYYAHRTDCASKYSVRVSLYGSDSTVVDEFHFKHKEPQWAGGQWHKVEHVFSDYPEGVLSVKVAHFGRDLQFWAGHYGSKITGSSLFLKWDH